MKLTQALFSILLFCVPLVGFCDQPAEQSPGRTGESICELNKGIWNTSDNTCAVTKAACEGLGQWQDDVGCVLTSINAAQCNGGVGLRAIGSACVIIYMTVDETTQ